jgi:hypothetical protein
MVPYREVTGSGAPGHSQGQDGRGARHRVGRPFRVQTQ